VTQASTCNATTTDRGKCRRPLTNGVCPHHGTSGAGTVAQAAPQLAAVGATASAAEPFADNSSGWKPASPHTRYDRDGYDRDGYNHHGFDRQGVNKHTGTDWTPRGADGISWREPQPMTDDDGRQVGTVRHGRNADGGPVLEVSDVSLEVEVQTNNGSFYSPPDSAPVPMDAKVFVCRDDYGGWYAEVDASGAAGAATLTYDDHEVADGDDDPTAVERALANGELYAVLDAAEQDGHFDVDPY
jgi:hypothetical protein